MANASTDQGNESDSTKIIEKSLETAVHDTAVQMGCWTAADDYLLIASVLHLCDLDLVHERVKFSLGFSLQNIRDRWQCLLYHAPISKMIIGKIQNLSMFQVEHLRIPFNHQEEELIATIPSHTNPSLLDDELDRCLSSHFPQFWKHRTISEMRECWHQLRQEFRLNDQIKTARMKSAQTVEERDLLNKMSQLLAPFEFELLSRDHPEFQNKTELPAALLYLKNRIFAIYDEKVTFGTERPDRKFNIVLDNDTSIHLQGFLVHRGSDFIIVNDGEHPIRVNGEWLNSNEMCSLGSRAIIQTMEKRRVPPPPPIPTFVLRSFPTGVCCVKYNSKDPSRLFTGDQQGSIELFNLETRRSMWKVANAHQSNVLDLHQIEDRLITLGKDGFVQLWNFQSENQWKYQTNHCSFSNCDVVSSNLIVVPVGNSESAVAALDHRSASVVARKFLPKNETSNNFGMVMKLRAMNDDFLCVGYENGSLCIFQVSSGEQIDCYQVTTDHQPITALDTYQHTCLSGNTSSTLISLDFLSSKLQPTENFRPVELVNPGTGFIRCRPSDGKLIAVAGWDSRIRLFRRETGKQLAMLDFHHQQVNSIDFQRSTQQMACASSDRTVSIWDLYQNQPMTNKNT